ncbi:MAG TPA: hypothetical protein VK826_11230 [Bacteroidia bacterium]|nr:hypothetical protein [Bacteroidia bacterium]
MKNVSVQIDNPCTENWAQMTPTEQGRFCGQCQKQVIDFTHLTDNEILKIFAEKSSGICGQFRDGQLNRKIVHTQLNGSGSRLNAFVAGILIAVGAGTSLSAQSTTVKLPGEVNSEVVKHPTGMVCTATIPADTTKPVLNAQVIDINTGESIPYAIVTIAGSNVGAQTDSAGNISFRIPDSFTQDTLVFVIQSPGYSPVQYSIARNQISETKKLLVHPEEIMRKGDVKIRMGKPSIRPTEDK